MKTQQQNELESEQQNDLNSQEQNQLKIKNRNLLKTNEENPLKNQQEISKAIDEDQLSETNDEEVAGFTIIGQNSTNQVLQINLYPKEQIFVRGKILYGNFDYRNKSQYLGYQNLSESLKEFIQSGFHPMRKVHNLKTHIVYAGISNGGGKILTIDNDVYGNDIFVNPAKVILSNVYHGNSIIKKHPNLRRFQNRMKVNERNEEMKTLIVLQSLNNNVIIEKYLGSGQKLYVEEGLIIGLSGSVKSQAGLSRFSTVKLQGPGWIFMENDSNSWVRQNKLTIIGIGLLLLWLVVELLGVSK